MQRLAQLAVDTTLLLPSTASQDVQSGQVESGSSSSAVVE